MDTSARLFEESQSQLDHSRLMALINSLRDGVLAVEADGKIVLSNSAALSLLDVNVANGRNLSEVVHLTGADGAAVELLKTLPNPNAFYNSDRLQLQSAGQTTPIYLSVSPVLQPGATPGQAGYVIVIRPL